jgi:hypothetical protein
MEKVVNKGKAVTLGGVEYAYRLDMGALLVFEQFTAKLPEELKTPQRMATMMHYACLYSAPGFEMSYDEFIACIDTVEVLEQLQAASTQEEKRWNARNLVGFEQKIEEAAEESKKN